MREGKGKVFVVNLPERLRSVSTRYGGYSRTLLFVPEKPEFCAMKIAIAQLNYHIGNFEGNLQKMLKATSEAKGKGADLIIFGELATTGYPPRDFLEFRDFIRLAEESVDQLREASEGIGIVVGSPTINPLPEGKDLHNSVYLLYNGETLHVQHKTLLPTYDVFDEYRYFEPAKNHSTVLFKGKRIALTVCEDLWNVGNENPLYTICPMDKMMPDSPDFIVNVSASLSTTTMRLNDLKCLKPMLNAIVSLYSIPISVGHRQRSSLTADRLYCHPTEQSMMNCPTSRKNCASISWTMCSKEDTSVNNLKTKWPWCMMP